MYRRYEPTYQKPQSNQSANKNNYTQKKTNNTAAQGGNSHSKATSQKPPPKKKPTHPLTRFLPQSIYDAETGKVFGLISAEDLLLLALILLLIDNGEEGEDSILIYALLYILVSEHIDLPFL